MKVFIFLFLVATADCLRLKLFKSPNYHDLHMEFELPSDKENSCVTTKHSVEIKSIKTDKCIIIYDDDSCKLIESNRVDNDVQSGTILFKSFHVCSQKLGGGPLLDVSFHKLSDATGYFLEFKNVCGCKNIPKSGRKVFDKEAVYFNNHGNGLAAYEKDNCEPPYVYVPPGQHYLDKEHWRKAPFKMHSFSAMGTTDCVRLSASVTKFTFTKDSPDKLMDVENVTSSLESVFRNNGTAKLTQDYTVAQRYKETVEFTKALGWSTVHNVGLSASVESDTSVDIPLVMSAEFKVKMGTSYDWTDTHSGTDTERKTVENEETTTIRQAIEIPPCTEYHVNSYVQMAKNYSIDYTATARLTGKAGDDIMDAFDLKNNVGAGMEFVRELDDYAVEVKVKGQMFAKYGMKTFIVGEGKPIEGCLQNIPKNSKQSAPKHFEIELPLKKGE